LIATVRAATAMVEGDPLFSTFSKKHHKFPEGKEDCRPVFFTIG
jgi:hypothetical protein